MILEFPSDSRGLDSAILQQCYQDLGPTNPHPSAVAAAPLEEVPPRLRSFGHQLPELCTREIVHLFHQFLQEAMA